MAVRLRYKLQVMISSSSTEEKDLGNLSFEIVTDILGEGGARKFTLAGGATDVQLSLGDVSDAKFVMIRTSSKDPTLDPADVEIKKDAPTNEPTVISPAGDAKEGHFLLSSAGLTALYASNLGTEDMELIVAVAGD